MLTHPAKNESRKKFFPLLSIVILYFVVGIQFAVLTPAWQVPDEPAHYNYVRQILETGRLPILEDGDYDQDLIANKIMPPKSRPDFSLDSVQYEDHQPPLFYLLATFVFAGFNGSLLALRIFSLCVSAISVCLTYLIGLQIFPDHLDVAAFATAFVAFLPQHLYMSAGFNNDSLAEALIALTILLAVRNICRSFQRERNSTGVSGEIQLGLTIGLCFITKAQAYVALPIALYGTVVSTALQQPASPSRMRLVIRRLLIVLIVSCLIGLPWWIRNMSTYGGVDFLGLQKHNEVVRGQLTMVESISEHGLFSLLSDMTQKTFKSYWAVFGWMSTPIDNRFYLAFLIFSILSVILYFGWRVYGHSLRMKPHGNQVPDAPGLSQAPYPILTPPQRQILNLFGFVFILALLGFVWYNLQFVQYQGRYLYAGIIPVAMAVSLSWHFSVSRWRTLRQWLWLMPTITLTILDLYLLWKVILPNL